MPPSLWSTYMLRWVSARRQSCVLRHRLSRWWRRTPIGRVDVYEWERQGTGSCQQTRGCVYLLSGGTSDDQSFFIDASANGDDVFFMTRGQLVPQDRDGSFEVYDARVGGGFSAVAAPVCTGADCQGAPPASPGFATPSSVTFSGAGISLLRPRRSSRRPSRRTKAKACRRGFAQEARPMREVQAEVKAKSRCR